MKHSSILVKRGRGSVVEYKHHHCQAIWTYFTEMNLFLHNGMIKKSVHCYTPERSFKMLHNPLFILCVIDELILTRYY